MAAVDLDGCHDNADDAEDAGPAGDSDGGTMLRRSARLLLISVVAVAPTMVSIGAAAAAPAPTAAPYEIVTRHPTSTSTSQVFGSADEDGPQIPVSTATTTFTVQFGSAVTDSDCRLLAGDGAVVASRAWYGEAEDGATHRDFAIPAGSIVDGSRYLVSCYDGYYAESRLSWNVIGTSGRTGVTETLAPVDALLTARLRESDYFDPSGDVHGVLGRGETVRVVATAGTWAPPGEPAPVTVELTPAAAPGQAVSLAPVAITSDGAALTFVVPADLPGAFADEVRVVITATATTPANGSTPQEIGRVQWGYSFAIAPKAASTVSAALSASTVLLTRPRVTVRVAAGGAVPVGKLVVYVDGHVVARATMTAFSAGTVTVPLPRISRGSHQVVAVFQTSDVALGSVSAPKPLRVLR